MPSAPAGGAVLKVEAVGLCASDVAQLHGHKHVPGEVSPLVPGHEIVGRIHELAPDANLGVSRGAARRRRPHPPLRRVRGVPERIAVLPADAALRLHAGPRRRHRAARRVRRVHGDHAQHPPGAADGVGPREPAVAVRAARQRRQLVRAHRAPGRRVGRDPGAGAHGPHLRGVREVARRGHRHRHRHRARRRAPRSRARASVPTT